MQLACSLPILNLLMTQRHNSMKKFLLATAIATLPLLTASYAYAEAKPNSFSADPRLIVYQFDKNNSYTVISAPNRVTNIQLSPDETLEMLILGDTVQWIPANTDTQVFLKPTKAGLSTSGQLVTSKRTYQLHLKSVEDSQTWFQRVSWNYPELIAYQRQVSAAKTQANELESSRIEQPIVERNIDIETLNFNYDVNGDADFKPSQIFDDGKSTWIKFSPRMQELPAMFMVDSDDRAVLVDYTQRADYYVLNRLVERALLKLGSQEVKIERGERGESRRVAPRMRSR